MSDLSQDSLLREIDEDLRRERYARLWKRFGIYIVGAAVAMLLAVAGWQFWQYRAQAEREASSVRFASALGLVATDRVAAERALAEIAADGPTGVAMLAGLRQAGLLSESNDVPAARAVYQQIQREARDPLYRDLAVVREALLALQGEAVPIDADAIAAKLKPLTADSNPWRFSAGELSAILATRSGQTEEARILLTGLSADLQAPPDMRERARQVLAELPDR
jgi:hypothetical protein